MAVAETPPLTLDFQAIPGCTDRSLTHLEGSCGSARVTGSGSLKRIQRWWGPSDPLPSEVSFADWGPVPARAGSGGSFEGRALPISHGEVRRAAAMPAPVPTLAGQETRRP